MVWLRAACPNQSEHHHANSCQNFSVFHTVSFVVCSPLRYVVWEETNLMSAKL